MGFLEIDPRKQGKIIHTGLEGQFTLLHDRRPRMSPFDLTLLDFSTGITEHASGQCLH